MNSIDLDCWETRGYYTKNKSWAVYSDKVGKFLAKFSPILEIGAGSCFWASKLRNLGAEVVVYDKYPVQKRAKNHYCRQTYVKPWIGGPEKVKKYPNHTLFLCWPPYADSMAYDALRKFQCNRVIYNGEGYGGWTGCDKFHNLLESWDRLDVDITVSSFYGINDCLSIFERKNCGREI